MMTGLITSVIGIFIINKGMLNQVQIKILTDLNSAKEFINNRTDTIQNTIYFSTLRDCIKISLMIKDITSLKECLDQIINTVKMDIAAITDKNGIVIYRGHNPVIFGDDQSNDQIINKVLASKKIVCGFILVPQSDLINEGRHIEKRINYNIEKADKGGYAMILKAAAPIWSDNGDFIGILYGGDIINQNFHLVDKIKKIVYNKHKGMDIGRVSIFQKDIRIATNVPTDDGERAVGTRASKEVYKKVIENGNQYIGRAYVVNSWYITGYLPLRDIDKQIIGMIGLGMIEQQFVDMKREALLIFLGVTMLGMIIVFLVSNIIANRITKPIKFLVNASQQISKGNFTLSAKIDSNDEIGELEKSFNIMAFKLQERDIKIAKQTQLQLMRSEKLAALGRMAAGVAHEINNPLTGVLMYGHLLLKKFPEDTQNWKDIEIIVKETTRCREIISNLLNFARESIPHKESANINDVIKDTISIIKNQIFFEKINLKLNLCNNLPDIKIDINQIEQVLINIMLNSVEAMSDGGDLIIKTNINENYTNIIIYITDTGYGIPYESIDKIFDPFFTTKEIGKGTGLGLAVSYGIIKRHGGQIIVDSQVEIGTTFTIILPIECFNKTNDEGVYDA